MQNPFALAIVRCKAQVFSQCGSNLCKGECSVSDESNSPPGQGGTQAAAGGSGGGPGKSQTVIKKYANRRLYNTATSTYVTLDDLSRMVKEGQDFVVFDAKSGEDITRSVLTQIIFEEENKGENTLLPINFLRQLIRFYGDSMQSMVPGYLEFSLGNLLKDQDTLRRQMMDSFGGDAFKAVEEQARRNMQLFQETLKMFPGFGAGFPSGLQSGFPPGFPTGFPNPFAGAASGGTPRPEAPAAGSSTRDDLQALKDQLAAMQQKIDALNK
jgi:polyhydroxyalkanoate synthesis repressor PhaR